MSNSNAMDKDTKEAVGTGAGALAGAAAGAALGTVIPGVGNAVGAVIGGALGLAGGAVAGRAIADHINPEVENQYWSENYSERPYAQDTSYDDLGPAYQYGWETRGQHPVNKRFEDVESDLGRDWDSKRGKSRLTWDRAKHATQDAWDRIERKLPGDFHGDGK